MIHFPIRLLRSESQRAGSLSVMGGSGDEEKVRMRAVGYNEGAGWHANSEDGKGLKCLMIARIAVETFGVQVIDGPRGVDLETRV